MTIENLQIEVQATSDQAASSLERLEAVLKRIDALGNSTGFDKLYRKLKKLSTLNFSGTESGLSNIEKTVGRITKTGSRIDKFSKTIKKVREEVQATAEEFSRFGKTSTPLLGSPKPIVPMSYTRPNSGGTSFGSNFGGNLEDGNPNWTRWNPWGSKEMFDWMFDTWSRNDFGNVPTSRRLTDGTIELGADSWHEMTKFESLLSSLKTKIGNVTQGLRDFNGILGQTGKKAKGTNSMLRAMKTILMYSLLFSAVTAIAKGVSEGMQNVAMYSKEANAVLTEYKTTTLQLKNSIGSALIPILQTFYPLISACANALIDIANALNVVFSALNGSKTFIKAKKYVDDCAKSLGKTKGMLGIDQIHTLGQTKNYDEMFETVEFDGWDVVGAIGQITTLVATLTLLQKLFKGTTWISTFGKGIKDLVAKIKNLNTVLPKTVKNLIGAAGIVVGFKLAKDAAYDLAKGSDNVGASVASLVGGVAMGVAGGAMIGGPIGAVIGGLIALTGAIVGTMQAYVELRKEFVQNHFFSDTGVKLDDLANCFINTWQETDRLASKTAAAQASIDESAEKIGQAHLKLQPYIDKIMETGSVTETEASDMSEYVTTMVDELENQMNTRVDSILDTFVSLVNLAKIDFKEELGDMSAAFAEFQALFGSVTDSYQGKIDDILQDAQKKDEDGNFVGLSDEKRKELQEAVNALASLNITVSGEQAVFDKFVADAKNGLSVESTDDALSILTDLQSKATAYQDNINSAYQTTLGNIDTLITQNESLYEQGMISEADYNRFANSFEQAKIDLTSAKDAALAKILKDVEDVANIVQIGLINNVSGLVDDLETQYDNASWWTKLWDSAYASEEKFVATGLSDAKSDIINPLTEALNALYSAVGSSDSAWTSDVMSDIWDYYIDTKTYTKRGHHATSYSYSGMTIEEAIKQALHDAGVPGYATGGFPEDGLFMANHGELVGKFSNGRTAVVNNEQIIEGIKRGVKEANEESGGGGNWIIQLVDTDGNLKSETIITATERRNRRDGKTIIPIGV